MHPETAKVLTLNPMNFGAKSIQMCGRYTVVHTHKELIARFRVTKALIESRARFNIAPTQKVPVVIYESQRVLEEVSWGLIPSWSKEPDKFKPLINARAETLAEKPSFRSALKKRRCLIPADGFFEWQTKAGKKIPVRITLKEGALFSFAGLYEDRKDPAGAPLRTCTIITVPANEKIAPIHERMPAILRPEDEEIWLTAKPEETEKAFGCLKSYPDDQIEYYEVSSLVNSARVDTEECIAPAARQLRLLPE